MFIKLISTVDMNDEESINFDLVKEYFVKGNILYIVQLGDDDANINSFEFRSVKEAIVYELALDKMLKVQLLKIGEI